MKNQSWAAIHDIFKEVTELWNQAQSFESVRDDQGQLRVVAKGLEGDKLVKMRAAIRSNLDVLKARLSENLTEREVYLVLFPVVVYFDELVMYTFLSQSHSNWPPLQKELFKIDNGGEIFYDTLDDILRKPETLPFVYEIFYFVLNDGFKGKFKDNEVKIAEYKKKLKEKIPVPTVQEQEEEEEQQQIFYFYKFPSWYYASLAGFLLVTYTAIYIYANW